MAITGFARPARATTATVEINRFAFAPAEIEIAAGGAVIFVNRDLVPHTATGDAFDTGPLRTGDQKEIVFPARGEYEYLCRFHHQMRGRVIVG